MILKHLILNRFALCACSVVWFSVSLMGCQPNVVPSIMTTLPVPDKITSAPTQQTPAIKGQAPEPTKATTLQWASHYQWQLAHVKDQKGNLVNIDTANPITLAVAPSSLSLSKGCQHFSIDFRWMSAPPFEYGSELRERPSTCESTTENKVSNTNIKKLFPNDNNIIKLDVELLSVAESNLVNTQMASKNLVVKIENGNTLIFTGKPLAFRKPTGLPIDNALLERYDWQLKSAVRNTFDVNRKIISRQSIGDFYHPEFPVSVKFRGYDDSQYASFNSNCNGVGGPYILMKDHTLLVGSGPQTLMGCGETGNRIEGELAKLISNSKSTLSLSLQPSQPISPTADKQTDMPRYNLLQTMATGETLVWQNEVKKIP